QRSLYAPGRRLRSSAESSRSSRKAARPSGQCGVPGPQSRSAPLANAVVDLVILFLNLAIERRRSRRLRNAWPRHSRAGRRLVVLIQKMARRWLADLRGPKSVILPIGRNARGGRKQEGGDGD